MYLSILSNEEKEAFIQVAYSLMNADGVMAEEELAMIDSYCAEMSIQKPSFESVDLEACRGVLADASLKARKVMYIELFALAKCDNEYDENEMAFMNGIRGMFGISRPDASYLEDLYERLNLLYEEMNGAIEAK